MAVYPFYTWCTSWMAGIHAHYKIARKELTQTMGCHGYDNDNEFYTITSFIAREGPTPSHPVRL
jgi:hypothetical protein